MRVPRFFLLCAALACPAISISGTCVGPHPFQRHHHSDHHVDVFELLKKGLERRAGFNVGAIITFGRGDGFSQKCRMLVDTSGRMKLVVLSPLTSAGRVMVDDGKTIEQYDPDKNFLRISPSPERDFLPVDSRIKLIRQNYKVTAEPAIYEFHRRVFPVKLEPKAKALPFHRYEIEPNSGLICLIQDWRAGESPNTTLQVEAMWPADDLSDDDFAIETADAVKVVHSSGSATFTGDDAARKVLGSKPAVPKRIPLGFIISKRYITHFKDLQAVGFTLTNGVEYVDVFEVKMGQDISALKKAVSKFGWPFAEKNNLGVTVAGSLPASVRQQIMNAFLN